MRNYAIIVSFKNFIHYTGDLDCLLNTTINNDNQYTFSFLFFFAIQKKDYANFIDYYESYTYN